MDHDLQVLGVGEATLSRLRRLYGGIRSDQAKWLKLQDEENQRLKQVRAELWLN